MLLTQHKGIFVTDLTIAADNAGKTYGVSCGSTIDPCSCYIYVPGSASCTFINEGNIRCVGTYTRTYPAQCVSPQETTRLLFPDTVTFIGHFSANKTPDPDKNRGDPCPKVGNPCNPGTGNKYEEVTDFSGNKYVPTFIRSFNSTYTDPVSRTPQGRWNHNYHRVVTFSQPIPTLPEYNYVTVARGDGRIVHFYANNTSNTAWLSEPDVTDRLTRTATGWLYTLQTGAKEEYNTAGKLVTEIDAAGRRTTIVYNTTGNVRNIIGPYGHTLTLGYDTQGRLATLADANGRVIKYGYDATNNLSSVTYPDGHITTYYYEDTRFLTFLTGVAYDGVRYSTFGYDAQGRANLTQHAQTNNTTPQEKFTLTYLTSPTTSTTGETTTAVTDAIGTIKYYVFETRNGVKQLMQSVSDVEDAKNYRYDVNGNLTCQYGALTTTVFTYNTTNQRTSKADNFSDTCVPPATARTTTYQYLSPTLDLPTVIESPSVAGATLKKRTTIAYTDPRFPTLPTRITQSGYTPTGLPVSRSVALSYNTRGQVVTVNGPRASSDPGMNGRDDITTLAYYDCITGTACGQLKSVTNALGQVTTYTVYTPDGRLQQKTDPNGLLSYYVYDPRGRVAVEYTYRLTGAMRYTQYTYTPFNQVKTVTVSPDNITYTYEYDAAQDLKRITDTLGNAVNYAYDVKGNHTTTWYVSPGNRLNQFTDKTFNLRNQVESLSQGGYLTTLINDAVGNLTQEIDPNHTAVASTASTVHQYDALNRLFQTTDLLNGTARYTYDTNDRVTQVTPPNQAGTTYRYDDLGNLLQEISPDRGTTTYTYDAAGNVLSITDARNVTVKYTYDPLNRVILTDYPSTPDVTTTYDTTPGCTNGLGQVCTTQDGTQTVNDTYDNFGHLATQTTTLQGKVYTTTYTRDPWGRVTRLTYPGGRVITTPRDSRGHMTGIAATVNGVTTTLVSNRTVRADGLIQSQTLGNGLADSRLYNYAGRLTTQSLGSLDTRVYRYDNNGNLTRKQTLPEVATYGYDVLNQLTNDNDPTPETLTYGTTSNGNRQTRNTQSYSYQSNSNRLISVAGASVVYDPAGNIKTHPLTGQTYSYNEAGQLSGVLQTSNLVAFYRYNPQGLRTLKFDGTTTILYHYDQQGHLLQETDTTGSLIRAYVWVEDRPIAQITKTPTGEVLTYLHTDHQNTPRLATNTLGKVVWRYEGNAFGDSLPNEDVDGDTVKTTINLRFPGQYYDAETGLHYNWNRYYDPRLGRYITSDPIGLGGGLNTYAYVLNNPLRWIDPTGLNPLGAGSQIIIPGPPGTNPGSSCGVPPAACIEACAITAQLLAASCAVFAPRPALIPPCLAAAEVWMISCVVNCQASQ